MFETKTPDPNTPPLVNPTVYKPKTSPNTPFITNGAKEVYTKKEYPPKNNPPQTQGFQGLKLEQPSFKLELYNQPAETKPPIPTYPFNLFTPNMQGIDRNLQHLYAPTSASSYGPNVNVPVQKVYNITLPGIAGGHNEASTILEVALPGKDHRFTSNTLGERLKMFEYVRQILVSVNDGENIGTDSSCKGHRNLMSYIKIMELNPNYYSTTQKNPYKGLPYGMLLFRSCFPIKLDQVSNKTICAKNSIGLNIRLYSLTLAEYYSHYLKQNIYKKYDVWRELIYYEYVRENIIRTMQSPNFTLLYAYFNSLNRNIDYFSLKKSTLTQKILLTLEYKIFERLNNIKYKVRPPNIADPDRPCAPNSPTNPCDPNNVILDPNTLLSKNPAEIKLPDEIDPNLQKYSGNLLIVLTEAPHHNLYQWASRIYEKEGIVQKMISHGYHDENVWMGILFQIVSALYVMQLHGLYISNMTIEDNIYIKDLQLEGNIIGYWKYIINGISYYIPNRGYLVMIDSNFKDLIPDNRASNPVIKRCFKIEAPALYGESADPDIQNKIYQNYRNIINTNSFGKDLTQNELTKPPPAVMNMISKMMEDTTETDLSKVIFKHFRNFLNNRIGTYLKKDIEVSNIRAPTESFKPGEMLALTEAKDTYRWAMYSGTGTSNKEKVLIKEKHDSIDIIEIEVDKNNLQQYSPTEKIEQNSSGLETKLSTDDLAETYIINSQK